MGGGQDDSGTGDRRAPVSAGVGGDKPGKSEGPTRPVRPAQILLYSVANLGFGAFYALNNAVLPLFLQAYTKDARILGLLGSTHSFEGAVIQPLVGAASDRMTGPLGRRRPFILVFVPLSAILVAAAPFCGGLGVSWRLPALIAAVFLFTVFFNVAQDPYQALIPDITPVRQRGRVSGVSMFVMVIGQASLGMLRVPLATKFYITAAVMPVTALITCWGIRERVGRPLAPRAHSPLRSLRAVLSGLGVLRQAGLALTGMFLAGLGIGAVVPYLTVFVKAITACTNQQAQSMFVVLQLSTAAGVLPFGWLADRIGVKRMLLAGLTVIAAAAVAGFWVDRLGEIAVLLAVAGLGNAAMTVSAYPLLTDLVPAEEMGFYTGLQSTALSIATPLTAWLTGTLVNAGGYRAIFWVCAATVIGAAAVLSRVRPKTAAEEVVRREADLALQDVVSDERRGPERGR